MTGYDIVLIEDKKSDAEIIVRALNKTGSPCKVLHLNDGKEASDYFTGNNNYSERDISVVPRFILLDLKMPKIGGIEVLKLLKNDAFTRKIPVIILTSSKEIADLKECYEAGANSYVVKPVSYNELCELLTTLKQYWLNFNQQPV